MIDRLLDASVRFRWAVLAVCTLSAMVLLVRSVG